MADTDDAPRSLPDLVDSGDTAMLVTPAPEGLTARPITCVEATPEELRFLVDRTADWAQALERTITTVNVSFAETDDNRFVSVSGVAVLAHDPDEVQRLWNPAATAFFDGPDDPKASVLTVRVDTGQWWDGPGGKIRQAFALVKTAVTRDHGDAGDMGRLDTSPQA